MLNTWPNFKKQNELKGVFEYLVSVATMSSDQTQPPPSTVIVPRPTRDQSVLATGWWEMITNLEKVPCMGKALGYGGVGGVFTGIVNRFMRQRM